MAKRPNNLGIISVRRRFDLEHKMKKKQEHDDTPASQNDTTDPSSLHLAEVVASGDDVECVLTSPSQHT